MRLIDADDLEEKGVQFTDTNVYIPIEAVWNAPTVEAVEVVRCKNCKHFDMQRMECQCDAIVTDNEGGASFSVNFDPDDFCSYGERRDNA